MCMRVRARVCLVSIFLCHLALVGPLAGYRPNRQADTGKWRMRLPVPVLGMPGPAVPSLRSPLARHVYTQRQTNEL